MFLIRLNLFAFVLPSLAFMIARYLQKYRDCLKVIINYMIVINFTCMTYERVLYFNHFRWLSGRLTIRELHENKVLKVI